MNMMPGMNQLKGVDLDGNEKMMDRVEAIILSMTKEERANPDLLNPSRKKRIAKGAGVDIAEINRIVKQFEQMKKDDEAVAGHDGRKTPGRTWRTDGKDEASLLKSNI